MPATVDTSMFWNVRRTLTHNMLYYVILGNRGGGKSFAIKEYVINNFIKKQEQFGYIRRYKDDLEEPMEKFFDDIAYKYPDYEFKATKKHLYIRLKTEDPDAAWTDKDIAGIGFTLSTANNKKSIPYPRITTLLFDEFLLDKGHQKYLNKEPEALLNLYETIARPGTDHPRVLLFMLANAISITNPYFLYWDLKMPTRQDKNGKWIWKHPTRPILVEDVRNEKFIEEKRKTEFGALIKDTTYEKYSIDNQFLLDNDTFVEKRSPKAKYYFTFIYKSHTLGVWADFTEGKIYVSKAVDPSYLLVYSITMQDHKPNTMLLKNRSRTSAFQVFIDNYQMGNVRFESINIKNICYEVIKMVMNMR